MNDVRKGSKIEIVGNSVGHGFVNGVLVTVEAPAFNGVYATDGVDTWGLSKDDFKVIEY